MQFFQTLSNRLISQKDHFRTIPNQLKGQMSLTLEGEFSS